MAVPEECWRYISAVQTTTATKIFMGVCIIILIISGFMLIYLKILDKNIKITKKENNK